MILKIIKKLHLKLYTNIKLENSDGYYKWFI